MPEAADIYEAKPGGKAAEHELRAIRGIAPRVAVEPKLDARAAKRAESARIDPDERAALHPPRHARSFRHADERRRPRASPELRRVTFSGLGTTRAASALRRRRRVRAAHHEESNETRGADDELPDHSSLIRTKRDRRSGAAGTPNPSGKTCASTPVGRHRLREAHQPVYAALQEPAQLLAVESCVPEDAAERAAFQFSVQRHNEECRAVSVLQSDVASALAQNLPAELLEHPDELRAGNDRQTSAHAGTGNLRRTIPAPIGRPSSRRPST